MKLVCRELGEDLGEAREGERVGKNILYEIPEE